MASRIVYARHMVYRICSAGILLLDQHCRLRFDEQGKTTVTTAHLETSHALSLKVEMTRRIHTEELTLKQLTSN